MTAQTSLLLRRAAVGLIFAILVFTVLTLVGDIGELRDVLGRFDWRWAPLIVALTVWNYAGRYLKWEMYLDALGVPRIPRWVNIRIFLSGFAMSITPGKVGEVIKAFQVQRLTGTPVERTAAAVAAERGTDGLAMLVLASVGATQFSYGRPFVALIAFLALAAILVLQRPALLHALVARLEGFPVAGRVAGRAEHFITSSSMLMRPRLLFRGTTVGIVSWSGECVAFLLILIALGIDASWSLLLIATFVLAVSSLAGGISMLPGGLGVADASVAGMLLALVDQPDMTRATAVAATLLVRFATLWFAVLLGFVALFSLERGSRGRVETTGPATTVTEGGRS